MSNPGLPPVPPPPPPTGPPPPPVGPGGTAPIGAAEPPRRRRRALLVGSLATAVIVVGGGAALAWQALDGGGTQPHDVLPGDAIGYVRVDLDPSASQKIEAFRFLRQFPLFDEATDLDDDGDLRELLVEQFAHDTDCPIDFEDDVEPWAGDRVGVAVLPPGDDQANPGFVVAVQTDDEDAAEAALTKVVNCGGEGTEIGTIYLDGYLLITDTADHAERYATSAQESPLSGNADFTEAMDLLGDQGVMSAWVSGTGMFDLGMGMADLTGYGAFPVAYDATRVAYDTGEYDAFSEPGMPTEDEARELIEDSFRSAAVTLRFDNDYAEVASVVTGDLIEAGDGSGVRADVPDDTTALLGFANGDTYLQDYWESMKDSYPEAGEMMTELEDMFGLTLPDDVGTLLGDSFVVAADIGDLDFDALEFGDFSSLDVGVKVATDPDAAQDVWDKVSDLAAESGVDLDAFAMEITDDGYVVAANPDYAATLIEGGNLVDNDVYTKAVKDAADASAVFYLNIDAVEDDLISMAGGELSDEELDSIRKLEAVGFSARSFDGHVELSLRITTG